HADLSRFSPDVHANAIMIEKGYTGALAIAALPQEDFVAATHEQLGDFGAASVYVAARTQVSILNNVLTDLMAYPPDGPAAETGRALFDARGNQGGLGLAKCHCDDCQAVMSPAAYLADLLSYALQHLAIVIRFRFGSLS